MTNSEAPDKYVMEGPYFYDDGAFCVWKSRSSLWKSADKEGNNLLTGPTKEAVEEATRWKLAGYPGGYTSNTGITMTGKDTL